MSIVKTVNLTKTYDSGVEVRALSEVNFELEKGALIAIIGDSGSGKSTLLHLLAGVDKPTSGEIYIQDMDITKLGKEELTIFRRRNIGVIYQFFNLIPNISVRKNILLPLLLDNKREDKKYFDEIIRTLGIEEKLDRFPKQLSGGEQQRVAIARSLITRPAIILADEPTGNLDRKNSEEICSLFRLVNKRFKSTIIIITHDEKDLVLRYNIDGKPMSVHVDGYIDKFPFDLKGQEASGIYLFTRMENLESFVEKYGQDSGDPTNSYIIKMKIKKNLTRVSDSCEKIVSSYIAKSDHSTTNKILNQASKREQTRNEHMLNLGIQVILVLLALSNAYNSFHGNLRARKREFQLLSTAGMTEKQIKKLIYGEIKILFKYATVFYVLMFVLAVCARSYRSNYDFAFVSKEILFNINYIPIILVFGVMVAGILMAIRSGIRDILDDDFNNMIRGF